MPSSAWRRRPRPHVRTAYDARVPRALLALALLACASWICVALPMGSAAMRIMANEAAKLLGVEVGTKGKELKRALRRKIRENHPDVVKDDGTRLRQVREAYAALDPDNVPGNWNLEGFESFEPHAAGAGMRSARRASSPSTGGVGSWSSPSAQRKAQEMQQEREERRAAAGRRADLKKRGFVENLMDEQMENQVFQSRPGEHQWRGTVPSTCMDWYRAMTNIRVRAQPSVESPVLGTVIRQGDTILVNAELVMNGQKFLKLKNQPGWVFQRGVSGEWQGKQILTKF